MRGRPCFNPSSTPIWWIRLRAQRRRWAGTAGARRRQARRGCGQAPRACRGRRCVAQHRRLLILKHIRNWSYGVLEREVRANLVYRDFTRVGGAKTPTLRRWALGRGAGGRRDQTDPHQDGDRGTEPWLDRRPPHARGHHGGGDQHPPSNQFELAGRRRAGAHSHHEEDHADRGRGRNQAARPEPQREAEGARHRRAARSKAKQGQEKLKRAYGQLLNSTGRVAGQAKRFSQEIAAGVNAQPTLCGN